MTEKDQAKTKRESGCCTVEVHVVKGAGTPREVRVRCGDESCCGAEEGEPSEPDSAEASDTPCCGSSGD